MGAGDCEFKSHHSDQNPAYTFALIKWANVDALNYGVRKIYLSFPLTWERVKYPRLTTAGPNYSDTWTE